ncbi:MAG: arylesterase [Ideonella sp.]|nr:arylesterase [Ideonella sp.]
MRRRDWLAHCSAWAAAALALAAGDGVAAVGARHTVLVVGDSMSAEYGLARGTGWVALLEKRLAAQKRSDVAVVNASVSGDTTSGGRSRLPELLARYKPTVVVLELGGNDALRGLPLAMTRENLVAMTQAAQAGGARVLLVGMQVPPNYGRKYADDFAGLFASVARAERAAVVPFLLKGVADGPQAEALFQADRIHPNAQAQATMLDNVWAGLQPLLR